MVLQNILHALIQGSSVSGSDRPASSIPEASNEGNFKDILGGLENNGRKASIMNNSEPATRHTDFGRLSKPGEVSMNKGANKPAQAKVETVVRRLAGYFGIGYHIMLSVLVHLGINPEDLLDSAKLGTIVNMLAEHFGLDDEEKDELYEMLKGYTLDSYKNS